MGTARISGPTIIAEQPTTRAKRSKAPRQQTSSNPCAPSIEPAGVSPHFLIRHVVLHL